MRPVVIILIVVAVLVSGATAFLAKRLIEGQTASALQKQKAVATDVENVLVAARDIATGTVIGAEDVRYQKWPKPLLNPRMVVQRAKEDPKADFVGAIARRAILAGEPMDKEAVYWLEEGGKLAGILKPGLRAMTINVTPATSVAGLAFPGDHVDVLLTADMNKLSEIKKKTGGDQGFIRYTSEVVLSNVRLLAIDQALYRDIQGKEKDMAKMVGKTATLEVTPAQAEKLAAASVLGQLSLVLRSGIKGSEQADDMNRFTPDLAVSRALNAFVKSQPAPEPAKAAPEPPKVPPARRNANKEVTINRGGALSTQQFGN
jgi:pilus assembly protein CpaB